MALVPSYHYYKCIINTKEIYFRPWTTKDEKAYLIAVESGEEISSDFMYENLIKPCLKEDIELSDIEKQLLMIEIRKKSIGSTFSINYTCSSSTCNKVNEIEVELDSVVNYKENDYKDVKIDNMIFSFREPTKNLKKKLETSNSNVETNFINLLIHIKEIEIDSKLENTFTFEELQEFVESLPSKQFDYLYSEFSKMKGFLEFSFTDNCLFCGSPNRIDLDKIPNFLWL